MPGRSSRTAEYLALFRALESVRRADAAAPRGRFRLPRLPAPGLAATAVFEVDQAATQAVKRSRLATRVPVDGRVRFVPVDLDRQAAGPLLRREGFGNGRTVVVLEGVTNYLSADAVDGLFRWLSTAVSPGSRVIFSYVDRAVLDGHSAVRGLDRSLGALRRSGEPWTFGLDPAEVAGYVAARGLVLTLDVSVHDAAEGYLGPLRRRNRAAPYYRIAQAVVE